MGRLANSCTRARSYIDSYPGHALYRRRLGFNVASGKSWTSGPPENTFRARLLSHQPLLPRLCRALVHEYVRLVLCIMAAPNPEAVEADALTPGYPLRLLGAPAYDANGWADGTTASRQTIVPSASAAPTQGFTFDGPGASPSTALSLVPAQQTLSLLGPSLLSTTPQSSCVAPLDPSANRAGFGSENQLTNTWTGSLHGQVSDMWSVWKFPRRSP